MTDLQDWPQKRLPKHLKLLNPRMHKNRKYQKFPHKRYKKLNLSHKQQNRQPRKHPVAVVLDSKLAFYLEEIQPKNLRLNRFQLPKNQSNKQLKLQLLKNRRVLLMRHM